MYSAQKNKFAIHEAAREGRFTVVEHLLKGNPRLTTQRDDDDRLPIHWAVSYGHLTVAELLVSRRDFDPDVKDGSGWTPLMIASSLQEGEELVDLLLKKEADVNAKSERVFAESHKARVLANAKVVKDNSGQTALHFCASKNNLDVARKLVSHGASSRIKDRRSQLPLHRAAAIGSVPMVNLLMDRLSPLNAPDIAGYTPLHHAISEGHGDAAMALLKAGAEFDKRDVDGHLALELAPDAKIRKYIVQGAEREGIDIVQ